jgi:sugar phosphate isomerase/epimerase
MISNRRELIFSSFAAAPTLTAARAMESTTFSPCINQVTTLDAPFAREVAAYAAAGFQNVELWLPKLDKLGIRPELASAMLREAGLNVVSVGGYGAAFDTPDDRIASEWKHRFETARALGAKHYTLHSGAASVHVSDYRAAVARLAHFADEAEWYGLTLGLEFVAGTRLVGSFRTALEMIRRADRANLGVCVDTFHLYSGVSKVEDLLLAKPGEITHVHFQDAPACVPREVWHDADRLPPGEGCMPMHDIVKALKRAGYRGPLSVELWGPHYQSGDPDEVAERCQRAVRQFC